MAFRLSVANGDDERVRRREDELLQSAPYAFLGRLGEFLLTLEDGFRRQSEVDDGGRAPPRPLPGLAFALLRVGLLGPNYGLAVATGDHALVCACAKGEAEALMHERKSDILDRITQDGKVLVGDLAKIYKVSEATVRRDIRELEEKGLLTRTFGGAVPLDYKRFEPSFKENAERYLEEKKSIGRYAASLIQDEDTLLLDAGTTTLELAKNLKAKNTTVLTNSIDILLELGMVFSGYLPLKPLCAIFKDIKTPLLSYFILSILILILFLIQLSSEA